MQHFRHRLGNLTGSQGTHIDSLEDAYEDNEPEVFQQALQKLRANAKDIANSFHKSRGYIKEPDMQKVTVFEIVEKTCQDMKERLQAQDPKLDIHVDKQLIAYTDLDIASLVLYSLLENALDATKDKTDAALTINAHFIDNAIALQVIDNGSGVSEEFQPKLFEMGRTTKFQGLGSALSFARTRMERMQGQLLFPLPQPNQGALFEMQLALPPVENCHD
jgi:signal transduction histidine kinase